MNLQEIQEIFRGDRFASEMGAEILEAEQGRARCALTIGPGHRNAAGGRSYVSMEETLANFRVYLREYFGA